MHPKSTNAFAALAVVLVIAAVTGVAYVIAPKAFPGASHRAAVSQSTTTELIAAETARSASAAASIVKIAEANTSAPASPAKNFIAQESPLALSKLPARDPQELLQAERRRSAVMEGQLEEARRLYGRAASQAEELNTRLTEAENARRAADTALLEAAAAQHRSNLITAAVAFVAIITGVVFFWIRLRYGNLTAAVASGLNELRQHHPALAPVVTTTLDTFLDRHEQTAIRRQT